MTSLEEARKRINFLEEENAALKAEISGFNLTLFSKIPCLSPQERKILELLFRAAPCVVPAARFHALCRENTLYADNSTRQLIANIRQKLKIKILSSWGKGYYITLETKEQLNKEYCQATKWAGLAEQAEQAEGY